MPGCAVSGCKTGYFGKVEFQTFPFPTSSDKLRQKWTEQANRDNWQPNKNSRVCAKHFGKEAFFENHKDSKGRKTKKPKLKPDAYPTLYLKSTNENEIVPKSTGKSSKNVESEELEKEVDDFGSQKFDIETTAEGESFIADPTDWLKIDHDYQNNHENNVHEKMSFNPWLVDSIQEFYFLKCPECNFTHKEEIDFKAHAIENHPLSIPFFETFDFTIEENGTFEGCDKESESNNTFITIKEEVLPMRNDYENSEKEFQTENDVNLIKKEEENDPLNMGNSIIKSEKEFLNSETVNFETLCKKSLDISNVESHKCSICISSFRSSKRLSQHIVAEHEGEKPFKCHICDARFFKQKTMKRHLTSVHAGLKPFKCSKCDSSFFQKFYMNRHIDSVHEGKKPYTCSFCGVKVAQKGYLKKHIESVHEGKKPYKCPTCDFRSSGKASLKNHISAIHEKKKPFQCSVCGISFTIRVNLQRHIVSVHERKKEYQCPKCDLSFSLSSNLKRHIANVHEGKKDFQCLICGHCFAQKKDMQNHIASVHEGKKPFKCSICDASFAQSGGLKRHIETVHEENMDKHIDSVHERKKQNNDMKENIVQEPMECKLCAITLKHPSNYIKHYQNEHGTLPPEYADKETFICDQCPNIYLSKKRLKSHISKIHMKTESMIKRDRIRNNENGMEYIDAFKCSSCKKVFSAGNIYIHHFQKIHGGLPPEYEDKEKFICDECPNIFLEKHRLRVHKSWVHSNKQWVQSKKKHRERNCKFCNKKYSQLRVLKEHIFREHEKTTVFQCEQCTRNYGTKSQLKAHIDNVHDRVKCSECGQEICNSFMLKRHKAKVHGIIPENAHHCKLCPLFFSSKGSLNSHIAKIHPEIKE